MSNDDSTSTRALEPIPTVIAVALVVAYAVLVAMLVGMRADTHWDRLVFLLGGFEAIVFAGAGWLFGTTVQRGKVEHANADAAQARQDADDAKQTAEAARAERNQAKDEAEKGLALGHAIKAKAAVVGNGRQGARPDEEPVSPELAELANLAQRLFPD